MKKIHILTLLTSLLLISSCSNQNPTKHDHIFDEGVLINDSTCKEQGTTKYTCEECGYYEIRQDVPLKKHQYGDHYEFNDEVHYKPIVCGCHDVKNETEEAHHMDEGVIIKPASGESYGTTKYTCTVCDYYYVKDDVEPSPTGNDGTYLKPFSCLDALTIGNSLAADEVTPMKYFIKGKVTSTKYDTSSIAKYGNMTFNISDDGTAKNEFYCYQLTYLDSAKFTTSNAVKVGDDVTIFSSITNYRGSVIETTGKGSAFVFAHNGKESKNIPSQGLPEEDPKAKVINISSLKTENASWKTSGAKSTSLYRIKGIVQYPNNSTYGNFDILDDSGFISVRGCTATKQVLKDGTDGKEINNDASFSSLGVQAGDELTIEGWYSYYAYSKNYGVPQFTGYVTKVTHNNKGKVTPLNYDTKETYSGSYYSTVDSLNGLELLTGLHNLMDSTHQTYISYNSLDNYFKRTDPISGGIRCFYSNSKVSNMNREHVWPQSSSSDLFGTSGAGSDIHHIRPSTGSYNSRRSNASFAPIFGEKGYDTISYTGGTPNKVTTNIFEPSDDLKGDVSRIIMYVYIHYTDATVDSYLKDKNETKGWKTGSYYGPLSLQYVMGPDRNNSINLLRKWNAEDPVSDIEITRNEEAFKIQGNRNPFIDHPSYMDRIFA